LPAWLVVARREFLERVRSIWFIVVTLLGPLGMAALIVIPAWLNARSAQKGIRIDVIDHTPRAEMAKRINETLGPLSKLVVVKAAPQSSTEADMLLRIRDRQIDGWLDFPVDTLAKNPLLSGKIVYRGANATNLQLLNLIRTIVQRAVQRIRAEDAGIPQEKLAVITAPIKFGSLHTTGSSKARSASGTFAIGYAVMLILYMAILLYAVNVMRSVVMEKTSRVVEVMISSVKPRSLMLGKILGVGGVGLFQLSIWMAIAALLIRYREAVLGLFGVSGAGAIQIPSVSFSAFMLILVYFVLGYFFYAALYAAIGAMVNSEQEAQQVQMPVVILLIVPVMCVQLVANDPRGGVAEVLTMIPFSSAVLMPMRYLLGGAGAGSVLASLAILVVSTAGAVYVAARIYRIGILMYGKRPSLREIARWIRHA
jgi:ABC-2 type transport system permease protein